MSSGYLADGARSEEGQDVRGVNARLEGSDAQEAPEHESGRKQKHK
jgi:hypothetical protein